MRRKDFKLKVCLSDGEGKKPLKTLKIAMAAKKRAVSDEPSECLTIFQPIVKDSATTDFIEALQQRLNKQLCSCCSSGCMSI